MDNSFEIDVPRQPTSTYKLEVIKASEIVVNALSSNDTNVSQLIGKNACANHEPELFFPIGGKDNISRIRIANIAKKICQDECIVRAQCLNIAINNGE